MWVVLTTGAVQHPKLKLQAMQENSVWAAMDEDIDLTMKNSFQLFKTQAQMFKYII